jgi:thioesterase domain-containing protein
MEERGEEIGFFAMIDTEPPVHRDGVSPGNVTGVPAFSVQSELEWLAGFLDGGSGMGVEIGREVPSGLEEFWASVLDRLEEAKPGIKVLKERVPPGMRRIIPGFDRLTLKELVYRLNVIRTLSNAGDRYVPGGKVKTPVHFFEAVRSERPASKGWQEYTVNPLKLYKIDGDHFSIFRNPVVTVFAETFSSILKEAFPGLSPFSFPSR